MLNKIFLLRHFRTMNNINQVLHGHSLTIPIAEKEPIFLDDKINTVYCSSALRCRETLDVFLETNKVDEILYTDLLLERDLGVLEGKLRQEAEREFPQLFQDGRLLLSSTPLQGELFCDFKKRVLEFWSTCEQTGQGNILICSHNQFLKLLVFTILKEEVTKKRWNQYKLPYGKVVEVI